MAFQSSVNLYRGFGIVGEKFSDAPAVATTYNLTTAGAFGLAFTSTAEGDAALGGTGVFAGLLVNPKAHILTGTAGDPLAPSNVLPANTVATLATKGQYIVTLTSAGAPGDIIEFNQTTGKLDALAPGTAASTGCTIIEGATVYKFNAAANGLAVINLG